MWFIWGVLGLGWTLALFDIFWPGWDRDHRR